MGRSNHCYGGWKIIYNGDPITLFYEDELLHRAHLERPWIFEMVIALQKEAIAGKYQHPRSKQELQQLIEQI